MPRREPRKTYRERRPYFHRRIEVKHIRKEYPTKLPLIVEKYKKEKSLPYLEKVKFLVPQEMTLAQFITVIRNRLKVQSTQTIYLTIAGKNIPTLTLTMAEIYSSYADEDGFLYVNYASEDMFG